MAIKMKSNLVWLIWCIGVWIYIINIHTHTKLPDFNIVKIQQIYSNTANVFSFAGRCWVQQAPGCVVPIYSAAHSGSSARGTLGTAKCCIDDGSIDGETISPGGVVIDGETCCQN